MVQWQTSLFAVGPVELDPAADTERVALDEGSWIDAALHPGASSAQATASLASNV